MSKPAPEPEPAPGQANANANAKAAPLPPSPADADLQQVSRLQAQDAVSWYFSHLNPYDTHAENMRRYWRRPCLAVTLQVLALPKVAAAPAPTSAPDGDEGTQTEDSDMNVVADHGIEEASNEQVMKEHQESVGDLKPAALLPIDGKNGQSGAAKPNLPAGAAAGWREYLQPIKSSSQPLNQLSDLSSHTGKSQSVYEKLPRRTKARLDAFLAGCLLAVSSGEDEASDDAHLDPFGKRAQNGDQPVTHGSVSIEDGLSGFQISSGVDKPKAGTKGRNGRAKAKVNTKMKTNAITNTSIKNHGNGEKNGKVTEEKSAKAAAPSGSTHSTSILRKRSSGTTKHPQISEEQLVVRLELYIRSLYRVQTLGEDCVVVMEPPRAIKARARYITSSFIVSAGCVRSVGPVLFKLLGYLTKELLAVEMLSEDIVKVIRRVASEYEHLTSFASLAFLSSPEKSAGSKLTPLILRYLKYIQVEWEDLVHQCELEAMLSQVLDDQMRRTFKTAEFRSIGHLLEVCQEFRSELHSIEISPNLSNDADSDAKFMMGSNAALKQALRDLQREVITVNGHVLPPVTSRKDLIYLLSQTLNSRSITDVPEKVAARNRRKEQRKLKSSSNSEGYRRTESCPSMVDTTPSMSHDSDVLSTSDYDSSDIDQGPDISQKSKPKRPRRRNFHLSTIDMLTRRLLIAASRTGMGGDAYFVVRDLFGGEDVEVVPSSSVGLHGRMIRPGTIDILVRLASVTIKCHASFDVYPKSLVGECEPLIQIHTTTTETIGLREVRSAESESSDDSIDPHGFKGGSSMIVQERQTSKTGWRTLTIRPALYEKVEVWNTPS